MEAKEGRPTNRSPPLGLLFERYNANGLKPKIEYPSKFYFIENLLSYWCTFRRYTFRNKPSAASSTIQLTNSALAVVNYCKKAAAVYGNILPPLNIPEPLVRPSTSNNSDSSSSKNLSTTTHPLTSAQGNRLSYQLNTYYKCQNYKCILIK